ncbi:M60 family metallopeptidase [Pedobacter foliorum]|uniref:M60 family metallopeptidase n=1 Tax=Pedobacter foliorum TaxID=2739058 RepID=UPI001567AA01|nr:M60 family metallopeptidase [Pedobacter foliorum]NRF39371.1 hypothetical protein [Pedobacter foliorum]
MTKRKLILSHLFLFALLTSAFGQSQSIRSELFKNTEIISLPKDEQTSTFFTIGLQPEIIGAIKVPVEVDMRGIGMIYSVLDQGKLILIGSDAYFKTNLLEDASVQQLFKNAINIAGGNKSKPVIAVTKNADKALLDFLNKQRASVYTIKDFNFKKKTNLLFLTEDVTDSLQLKNIEQFIKKGGTLVFGSPYQQINKNKVEGAPAAFLNINKLFARAGVINANFMVTSTPENKVIITDSIPDYLHINTMLPRLLGVKTRLDQYVDYFLTTPNIELIFKYNEDGSPVLNKIKQFFKIPDTLPVATLESPVITDTEEKKYAMKMAYWFYNKRQDFAKHPDAKFLGFESFPGKVADGAVRVSQEVSIPVMVGTQGLSDVASVYYRPHSTGLYVAAGEKVKITIPKSYLSEHLEAQIGLHDDDVTGLDELTRIGVDLTKKFVLDKETTEIYSPFGGLLLINVGDTTKLRLIKVQVEGAVKAPYFKLGETTEEEWNATTKNNPAPWAELATNNIVLTVPSYRIRNLNNPVKLMKFWDEVMDADADLAIISKKRVHQERIIVDRQVAYGYMFTMYNKIVVPDDQSTEWMLDADFIRSHGSWGAFHELGHRHQFWGLDYPGTGEVTVNLFTMYVYDKVLKKGLYNHDDLPDLAAVTKRVKKYLANDPSYAKWSEDPFLALCMYIQIIDHFGWDAIIGANTIYRNLPKDQYPKTDQDKIDLWFETICKTTNSDLTRFFDVWKLPVSEKAKEQAKKYKSWFPKELE